MKQTSLSTIETFIAHFNEIDKYLEQLIKTKKFLPYNEKLKIIAHGKWTISSFVNQYLHELEYFGELRNQFAHSLRVDGKVMSQPTSFALEHIETFKKILLCPKQCGELFVKKIPMVYSSDTIQSVRSIMQQNQLFHLPVYDGSKYLGVANTELIVSHIDRGGSLTQSIDSLAFDDNQIFYYFINHDHTLFELENLMIHHSKTKHIGAFFVMNNNQKNNLRGVVFPQDMINAYQKFFF